MIYGVKADAQPEALPQVLDLNRHLAYQIESISARPIMAYHPGRR